jgi:hypothetical protein
MDVLARRSRAVVEFVAAAVVGLILLPTIFGALLAHDVQIGERISVVDLGWLILAVVASVVAIHARDGLGRDLRSWIERLAAQSSHDPAGQSDATTLGIAVGNGLLNLVVLLVVQAAIRPPLVGLVGALASPALVDSGFVIVVVLVALWILVDLRRTSRPLTEHLAQAGLDLIIPTAGFVTPSAQAAFATRLATTTASRPTTVTPPRAGPSLPPSAPPAAPVLPREQPEVPAETIGGAAAPTVPAAAAAPETPVALPDAATALAPSEPPDRTGGPSLGAAAEVTVVAEPSRVRPGAPGESPSATQAQPAGAAEPRDETTVDGRTDADQTILAGPRPDVVASSPPISGLEPGAAPGTSPKETLIAESTDATGATAPPPSTAGDEKDGTP